MMDASFDDWADAGFPGDPPSRGGSMAVVTCTKRKSAFYSAAFLKGKAVAPREWLVDGLIPQKNGDVVRRRWRHGQESFGAATCRGRICCAALDRQARF